jgi:hypothetical protein
MCALVQPIGSWCDRIRHGVEAAWRNKRLRSYLVCKIRLWPLRDDAVERTDDRAALLYYNKALAAQIERIKVEGRYRVLS